MGVYPGKKAPFAGVWTRNDMWASASGWAYAANFTVIDIQRDTPLQLTLMISNRHRVPIGSRSITLTSYLHSIITADLVYDIETITLMLYILYNIIVSIQLYVGVV